MLDPSQFTGLLCIPHLKSSSQFLMLKFIAMEAIIVVSKDQRIMISWVD